jgi:hypothetical protein
MGIILIIFSYLKWHYSQSLKDAVSIWWNFLAFFYHFFSIGILTRTFFKPWRRMKEYYGEGLEIGKLLESFIVNSVLRGVGIVLRTVIILIGSTMEIFIFFSGIILILIWFFAPVIAADFFVIGVYLLA